MANVMSVEKRNTILRLLVEGNSIRSVCRLMQTQIRTVLRQLLWAGEHCQRLMDDRFTGLTLNHLETDEMWTFVGKKQSRLTVDERRERSDIGDVYLWYSIDQDTKLVPTFLLGKRSADNARRFMVELRSRLEMPNVRPHDTDRLIEVAQQILPTYNQMSPKQQVEYWLMVNPDDPRWPASLKPALTFIKENGISPSEVPREDVLRGPAVYEQKGSASAGLQQLGQRLNAASPSTPVTGK
jgi:hypothetical protein